MRRLICVLSLICLVAQQLVCCCALDVHAGKPLANGSRDDLRLFESRTLVIAPVDSKQSRGQSRGHACLHHHCPSSIFEQAQGDNEEQRNSVPSGPHQHHHCVGTHIFYRAVDLSSVPNLLAALVAVCLEPVALVDCSVDVVHLHGFPTDRVFHPDRPQLPVYRL